MQNNLPLFCFAMSFLIMRIIRNVYRGKIIFPGRNQAFYSFEKFYNIQYVSLIDHLFTPCEYYTLIYQKPKKRGHKSRTLKDSKKEARKFRASFYFVLYRNKQDIWAPNVTC